MIIEGIMNIFKALILFVVSLFPTLPDFSFIADLLLPILEIVKLTNYFISIPVVVTCVLALLLVYNARFLWSIVVWVLRKIPGVD